MERRNFLKTAGLFSAGIYASKLPVIAGPFGASLNTGEIPVNKKLDPAWVKSLFNRGSATVYHASKDELKFIGMPVGGMHTGTLYLGGDGRLWLWDIFNDNREGIEPKTVPWETELHVGKKIRSRDGAAYVSPATNIRPVEQGFAFRITTPTGTYFKKMVAEDWSDIAFEATYPMATVRYIDKNLPVEITAEIYSPFIPLNENDSGLPATIYQFKIKNTGKQDVHVNVVGWLENKTCIQLNESSASRKNQVVNKDGFSCLQYSIESAATDLSERNDFGTMSLACRQTDAKLLPQIKWPVTTDIFQQTETQTASTSVQEKLIGAVHHRMNIISGEEKSADFYLTWHFPNLEFKEIPDKKRFYSTRFKDAPAVAGYVHQQFNYLSSQSRLWKNTWYDSTLPWWFLERTLLNISCLATTTAHRMASGRYYAWEGIGCCPGTCTHVWQYAQAPGRLFPAMERDVRERIDLGLSYQPDGSMWYRCEADRRPAVDGQAGTILRFYREHQMSANNDFLKRNWLKIKQTTSFLISLDKNGDGMEDTPVENTLDAMWGGEISWIVGLCIAAVRAGAEMADEMGDTSFKEICIKYVEAGTRNMEKHLFNGEYFIHRPDAITGRQKIGSYNTCHIDQVYGQSWAHQVGLGQILNKEMTSKALQSLWKYNFTPDVGPYIKDHLGGRPYALAGEGGMIMNSNPKNESKPYGDEVTWQMGYFHECMSGFEHQVAAHMMAEGMTEESLVLTRMIHDRYHASKRNPFNEIECSDHYARAMASYGTFLTACGFEYHGPKGKMKFNPAFGADLFKAPFTVAEGWGTFEQQKENGKMNGSILMFSGKLELKQLSVHFEHPVKKFTAKLNGKKLSTKLTESGNEKSLHFENQITLDTNSKLEFDLI